MKMDKETLIRHRFWVLAGAEIPLVLIALAVLVFGVRSQVVATQQKIESQVNKPKEIKEARNDRWVERLKKEEAAVVKVLHRVWKEGWDSQAELVTWPQDVQKEFNEGLFAVTVKATETKGKAAKPPVTPLKDKDFLIRGEVLEKKDYRIKVHAWIEKDIPVSTTPPLPPGTPAKAKPPKPDEQDLYFYFTPHMKLSAPNYTEQEVESFEKLQPGNQVEITYYRGKYFGDDFNDDEKDRFAASYFEQFPPLRDFFRNVKGEEYVLLRGGWKEGDTNQATTENMPSFFRRDMEWPKDPRPTAEKIWNAQEDFWIQRELLRVIQQANRYVAVFKGEGGNAEGKTYVFTNPYWQIEVTRKGNQYTTKYTNISRQMQKLNVSFRFQLTNPSGSREKPLYKIVRVDGQPLRPKAFIEPPVWEVPDTTPEGIFGIEQALTTETAPVKQLDNLGLDVHSHRTFPKGFKNRFGTKEQKQPAADQSKKNTLRMPGGAEQEVASEKKGPHPRYSESTPQFRKLPVAVVLLVDQDSAHYALTAFEESKLRFQITQVTLTHYPGKLEGQKRKSKEKGKGEKDTKKEKAPSPEEGEPEPVMKSGGGGGMKMTLRGLPTSRGGRRGGMVQPTGQQPGPFAGYAGEQGAIMELVVYGYATLYERFPEKNKAVQLTPTSTTTPPAPAPAR